jgi:acetyl esterase/lipase
VRFVHQSIYYPVTDAAMDTGSHAQFAEGNFLTTKAMAWFWGCYCPDLERRSEPFASPCGRATSSSMPSRRRS